MQDVTFVAAYGPDSITVNGAVSLLRAYPRVKLLPDKDLLTAEVVLVVAPMLTAGIMRHIRQAARLTQAPMVLVTDQISTDYLMPAIEYGVVAVLPAAHVTGQMMLHAIMAAKTDRAQLSQRLTRAVLNRLHDIQTGRIDPHCMSMAALQPRELDILKFLSEGLDTPEIAEKMNYSIRSVKGIIHTILKKTGVRNRVQAVAEALRAGVI